MCRWTGSDPVLPGPVDRHRCAGSGVTTGVVQLDAQVHAAGRKVCDVSGLPPHRSIDECGDTPRRPLDGPAVPLRGVDGEIAMLTLVVGAVMEPELRVLACRIDNFHEVDLSTGWPVVGVRPQQKER